MKKIAVYTCITGGYEEVKEPLTIEDECDYFLISDNEGMRKEPYHWIDVDLTVPDKEMSNKDKNRYCKLHPHLLFLGYDYSIYLDGSIQIKRPIAHNVTCVGQSGLALHKHRSGDCVYTEGIFLTWLGVVKKEEMIEEASRFMNIGIPRHFGLRECSMIVTDLRNSIALELYDKWYEEYLRGSKRDQQALIYTLWDMGLCVDDIGNLGGDFYLNNNPDIEWDVSNHYRNSND